MKGFKPEGQRVALSGVNCWLWDSGVGLAVLGPYLFLISFWVSFLFCLVCLLFALFADSPVRHGSFSILVFCLSCCQSLLAVCMSAFVRAIRLHRLGMLNQDHNEIMFTNIRYYQNLYFLEYPPLVLIAGDIAYSWNPCLRPILVLHYANKCSCSCDVCWYLQARHRFKENHGSKNEEEEPTLGSYLHKSIGCSKHDPLFQLKPFSIFSCRMWHQDVANNGLTTKWVWKSCNLVKWTIMTKTVLLLQQRERAMSICVTYVGKPFYIPAGWWSRS